MARSKNKNEKSVTSKREKSRKNGKRRPAVNNRSSSSSSDKEDYSTSRSTSSSRSDRKRKNKRRDRSSLRSSSSSPRSRSRSVKRSSRGSRSEKKSNKRTTKKENSVTSKREQSRKNGKRRPAANKRSSSSSSDKEDYSTSRSTSSSRSDRKIKNKRRDRSSSRSSTSSSRSRSRSAKRRSCGSRSEKKSKKITTKKERVTVPMKNKRYAKQHSCSKSKAPEIIRTRKSTCSKIRTVDTTKCQTPISKVASHNENKAPNSTSPAVLRAQQNVSFNGQSSMRSQSPGTPNNYQYLASLPDVFGDGGKYVPPKTPEKESMNATQSKKPESSASGSVQDPNYQTLAGVAGDGTFAMWKVKQRLEAKRRAADNTPKKEAMKATQSKKTESAASDVKKENGTSTKDPQYETLAGVAGEVFGGSGGSKCPIIKGTGAKESLNVTQSKKPESPASDPNYQTLAGVGPECFGGGPNSIHPSLQARIDQREKEARERRLEYEATLKQESSKKSVENGTPTKDSFKPSGHP